MSPDAKYWLEPSRIDPCNAPSKNDNKQLNSIRMQNNQVLIYKAKPNGNPAS